MIAPTETIKVEVSTELEIPEEAEFTLTYDHYDPIDLYRKIAIRGTKIEISDTKNVFEVDNANPVM
jgi:hypothetical protein